MAALSRQERDRLAMVRDEHQPEFTEEPPEQLRFHLGITSGNSAAWVPSAVDVSIPADDAEIERAAMLAAYAYAYGRAVGGRFFDPPTAAE